MQIIENCFHIIVCHHCLSSHPIFKSRNSFATEPLGGGVLGTALDGGPGGSGGWVAGGLPGGSGGLGGPGGSGGLPSLKVSKFTQFLPVSPARFLSRDNLPTEPLGSCFGTWRAVVSQGVWAMRIKGEKLPTSLCSFSLSLPQSDEPQLNIQLS